MKLERRVREVNYALGVFRFDQTQMKVALNHMGEAKNKWGKSTMY